jgi:hypothetical protein
MGMIGASTTKNTVPSNIKAGSYYNYLVRHGKKIPDKPAKGYGNFAQGQHVDKARVIEQYGKFDPLQYPKSSSFTENLLGNEQPMTLDTHEWRQLGMAAKDPRFLEYSVGEKGGPKFRPSREFKEGKLSMEEAIGKPTYWQAAPEKSEYGLYEQLVEPTVKRTGVTPASFQGHKWIGGKGETGVSSPDEPFLRTVASKIYYTALRMGEDPIKVLDYYVKGGPLLGVTGAAAGLSALPDEEESDQDGLQY